VPSEADMRQKNRYTSTWTSKALLLLVFIAFIPPPSAKSQSPADPSEPANELTTSSIGTQPGKVTSDVSPSTRSSGLVDLNLDDLPNGPSASYRSSLSGSMVQSTRKAPPETNVQWRAAIQESLLYTGIMHTFNLWTEAGTRDTLYGPWLNDYLHSVSELRGWSDSDRFMAPYVGHTLEGSIFGYIERQNDPRYRNVQFGDGREYYMSLLHSLAYSAVWHTQWKIGPASEASIGNVMLHASPGFITLADTPTLGTVEMLAEDAADRYAIMGLENRTANRALLLLARTFLNPGRSFASVVAFKKPWTRPDRIGIFGESFRVRQELLADYRAGGEKPFEYVRPPRPQFEHEYPKEADIELTAFPVYERFLKSGENCVGGGGSGASRVNPYFQLIGEVSGCLIMNMPAANQSADMLFYGGGLRWTPLAAHRVSPYLQLMFGGRKVTFETDDIPLRKELLAEWNDGNGTLPHFPKRSDWSVEVAQNGPALGVGSGFDVVLNRAFAWRLVNVEYTRAWMEDTVMIQPQRSLRITTGAVLRIGTW
jgi:hypothetical protein